MASQYLSSPSYSSDEASPTLSPLDSYHNSMSYKVATVKPGKIHLDFIPTMSHAVLNSFNASETKQSTSIVRVKDKEDRATVEQCLDPRTRVILVKMLNNHLLREINGCLSTGKEANVYHAWSWDRKKEIAIKIYKTSILIFKDRERYVAGEFRFRAGHCKFFFRFTVYLPYILVK